MNFALWLALHTISSGNVAVRLCRSLRCYSVRSVGPELASGMGRNVQGSIAWPVASTEVNIAVFEEEPSAPVRIFMWRMLGYAQPQDRLDSAEHNHGRELCSVQLIELVVMTLAENQEGSARMELPLCRVRAADSIRRCARLQRWIRRHICRVALPNTR
jgi:hypothetical protein